MKNTIKTLSLSAAALMALMVGVGNVQAAETTNISGGVAGEGYVATTEKAAEAKSTAEFEVIGGDLTLDAVPDMQFGKTSVKDIVTEATTTLTYQNGVVNNKKTADGNPNGRIRVSDYRGTGAGWNLSIALGDFVDINNEDNVLSGVTLTLNAPLDDGNSLAASSKENIEVTPTKAATVVNALSDKVEGNKTPGTGENVYTITKSDTTLKIDQNKAVKAGTYQADLTWTLANTPSTTAAK